MTHCPQCGSAMSSGATCYHLPVVSETPAPLTLVVSEIRQGEENSGPLDSTDLHVEGRGISLLVNTRADQGLSYALWVDGKERHAGEIQRAGSPETPAPTREICICAAIKLEDGRIIRGHRHDDCIQTALKWREAGQDVKDGGLNAQGFVTSLNRYVDRKEGMRLQVAAGLFKPRQGAQILMSEDLY